MTVSPRQPVAKAHGRFSETAIDEELVVMNIASGDFFALTGTARAIWDMIDGARDAAVIASELAATHTGDPQAIAADVAHFLAELAGAGLLEQG